MRQRLEKPPAGHFAEPPGKTSLNVHMSEPAIGSEPQRSSNCCSEARINFRRRTHSPSPARVQRPLWELSAGRILAKRRSHHRSSPGMYTSADVRYWSADAAAGSTPADYWAASNGRQPPHQRTLRWLE